jgi:ABC-type multidrug transport system permease subunit
MDEPTSGLDARAATIVMRTVRNTVDTGRTVVCTIHQPSIDIFEAFDELVLMKRGQLIYVGPLGPQSRALVDYLEAIEGVAKITPGYNPATWMLEVTSINSAIRLGVDFAEIYQNSSLYQRNEALIQDISNPLPGSKDLSFERQFAQPFAVQTLACLWKQHWSYWRNPQYNSVRFFFTLACGFLYGTIFWRIGRKTDRQQDLLNAMGSMFSAMLFLGFGNVVFVLPVVDVERTVFYREKAAGMYSALPYALAQVLIEVPYIFVQTVVYAVIVYALIDFRWTAAKFFWYFFIMFFTLLYTTYYGMMTVALTPNASTASVLSSGCIAIWMVFCGFIIPRPRIPVWWRWYYWGSPFTWTLYGLIASQFGDISDEMVMADGGKQEVNKFLRRYFGYRHDFMGPVAVATVSFALLFALIFAVSIKTLNFQTR